MRKLFIPFAKLLGIFLMFRPLFYISYMFYHMSSRAISGEGFNWSVLLPSCMYALDLLLALILIFKTEKIADILRLPDNGNDSIVIKSDSILYNGLILISICKIIYALPALMSGSIVIMYYKDTSLIYKERFMDSIFQIAFGICLLFLANLLTRFFNKQS